MSLLEKGLGTIQNDRIVEDKKRIAQKWEKIGLLEGLQGTNKENMAVLFENQLGWIAKNRHKISLTEGTTANSSGSFETVAFPVIRRVFSKLLMNDIASVQALSLPIGKLFYLNPKISRRKDLDSDGTRESHQEFDGAYSNAARLTGTTGVQYEERSLYDAYYATLYDDYGTALFDRSRGRIELNECTVNIVDGTIGTDRFITANVTGFTTNPECTQLIGSTGVPIDTEEFLASLRVFPLGGDLGVTGSTYTEYTKTTGDTVPYNVQLSPYGKPIVTGGTLTIVIDTGYPGADSGFKYTPLGANGGATGFQAVWYTYSSLEADSEMAEVSFDMDDVQVAVTTRKMRAHWTPELAMDLQQFHNIDVEAELTALLSETIAAEIDRDGLRAMRNSAAWVDRWDYNGWRKSSSTYYGVQKDYNQTLITKINQISHQIHKATLRGGANWVVVSTEASAVFDDLEYFHVSNAAPEQDQYNMGIERAGSLSGRYTVYRDPLAPPNYILIGRKGTSIFEAGYIYAPYVPMELTPVIVNPTDFTNLRGIQQRSAFKVVNARFYGTIRVDGLQSYGVGLLR